MQEDAMKRHSMLAVVLMLSSSGVAIPSPKQPHTIFEEEEDDKERNNPTQFHLLPCMLTTPRSKVQSSNFCFNLYILF
jgi:hypothetical protein